jgi:hypothetical protein
MDEVVYSVDYTLHVATREDAVQLVEHVPYRGQTLSTKDLNAYAGPVIEQTVNQLVQVTPLLQVQNLRQDLSQVVHRQLQEFLFSYGITLDEVKVQVSSRDGHIKARPQLPAFGKSELDAVYYATTMRNNSTDHHLNGQKEDLEQNMYVYMSLRTELDRYANEIATIQAELESTRVDFDQRVDAHRARLLEFLRARSSDLQASTSALDSPEAPLGDVAPQYSTRRKGLTLPDLHSSR